MMYGCPHWSVRCTPTRTQYPEGAHNIGAGVTFSSQVQGTLCEAWEHLNEVLQKAHLARDNVESVSQPMSSSSSLPSKRAHKVSADFIFVEYWEKRVSTGSGNQQRSRVPYPVGSAVDHPVPLGRRQRQLHASRVVFQSMLTQVGRSKCSLRRGRS